MKISELIAKLEAVKAESGDLEVVSFLYDGAPQVIVEKRGVCRNRPPSRRPPNVLTIK